MAYVKKKKTNQKSSQRKTHRSQTKRKKYQAKPGKKTRSKQVTKHIKASHGRLTCSTAKCCQLTKKARGVLSSCVEDLCQEVSSEANRLRKKIHEPTISQKVLITALEQSMAKENVRRSLTEGTKKTKKKRQLAGNTSCPNEKQAASTKAGKQSASPVFHKCS